MPSNSFTDKQLIEQLVAGDGKAFDLLFEKYLHKLYLFATENIGDRELAREIVMDVLFKLWQNRENLEHIKSLSAYLYSSVKYAIIDHYRKKSLQLTTLEDLHHEVLSGHQADTNLIDRELQQALKDGVEYLSPQRRLIFEMKREQDLSHKEIAEHLDLSTKTVENHMTAAISSLKTYLKKRTHLSIPAVLLILLFK